MAADEAPSPPDLANGTSEGAAPKILSEPPTPPLDGANAEQAKVESLPNTAVEESVTTNAASLPTEPEKSKTSSEDPIVFIDGLGARWILPFETAKTLEGLKALIKGIFTNTMCSYWPYRDFADGDGERTFSIVRIPEEVSILPDLWEKLVKPGWHIKILFEGKSSYVTDTIEAKAKAEAEAEKKKASEAKEEKESEEAPEVSYVASMYQHDGSSYPDFLRRATFKEPVTKLIREKTTSTESVLCEVRNVFIPRSKYQLARADDYVRIENDDTIGITTLEIQSAPLLDALHAVLQFQTPDENEPDGGFSVRDNGTNLKAGRFKYPYMDLYHHMDELVAYRNRPDEERRRHTDDYNEKCDKHIDILLKYLDNQPSIGVSKAKLAWSQKIPLTSFGSLWLLFKPGTDVYVRERGCLNAYVIESIDRVPAAGTSRARPFLVKVWNLDFNGKTLGRSSQKVSIPVFDGEREITSLPLYPTRFHRDKEGEKPLRETLIERGKRFIKVVIKPTYQEYTGPSTFTFPRTFNQARVIVDHTGRPWETERSSQRHIPSVSYEHNLGTNTRVPACSCFTCTQTNASSLYRRVCYDEYDDIPLDSVDKITEHQYLLSFSHVYVYALQDRLWDLVEVRGLTPPRINEKVIETLVMKPETNKDMIKAICETYSAKEGRKSMFFADYIRGKGEGQIILLHGPPGTGKTLTAESVSEFLSRPLLSITAADLGHEPDELETNLVQFFRNANKWDAIVLLDEADIYLERRHTNELKRNSIVSIFLRQLDYFQGILFLTTNRVGSFDEAFMSRIHIQIGYDPLDDDARKKIWQNSIRKLAENSETGRETLFSAGAKEYLTESKKLKELNWNGREIRNAFQTAVALATFEAKRDKKDSTKVTEEHLIQVVEMSVTFKEYMKQTLRADDSKLAWNNKLRADDMRFKIVPVPNTSSDV